RPIFLVLAPLAPAKAGAGHQNNQITRITTFSTSSSQLPTFQPVCDIFRLVKMESRIKDALRFIDDFSDAKIATVARDFGVPCGRLRYLVEGRPQKQASQQRIQSLRCQKRRQCVATSTALTVSILRCAQSSLPMRRIPSCVTGA